MEPNSISRVRCSHHAASWIILPRSTCPWTKVLPFNTWIKYTTFHWSSLNVTSNGPNPASKIRYTDLKKLNRTKLIRDFPIFQQWEFRSSISDLSKWNFKDSLDIFLTAPSVSYNFTKFKEIKVFINYRSLKDFLELFLEPGLINTTTLYNFINLN